MDRDEKHWTERGNIGQRGEIWDSEGTYWVEWGNIGQK